jgi:hypothetical protein
MLQMKKMNMLKEKDAEFLFDSLDTKKNGYLGFGEFFKGLYNGCS